MGFVSLDFKSMNGFLKEISIINNLNEKLQKVNEFVNKLDEEMKKIEAFKRELPLSMLLLKDAILFLNEEAAHYSKINGDDEQVFIEEFMPLRKENYKKINDEINDDKKNWMSSVQLWTSYKEDGVEMNNSSERRGFSPKIQSYPSLTGFGEKLDKEDVGVVVGVPGLCLVTPEIEQPKQATRVYASVSPASSGLSSVRVGPQQPTSRKQRRCWSPELHRRFVDALTQLGGPQVATPKQIRELMRVDGLTNDEVKSHLQKYRIHSKRVPNVSSIAEYENGNGSTISWASKPSNSPSGSPEGPLQFPGSTGGTSTTGGDSIEDEDDEKLDTYSWKGHLHRPGKEEV